MRKRKIEILLHQYKENFPIIAITGPRQSGKTTLAKMTFPDYEYISLETPENRFFAQEDPKGFLEKYKKFCIFDEIQNVPHLFSYLQEKVDTDNLNAQYILTGSQNFLLSEHISQSLAGRVGMLTLLPFQYSEIEDIAKEKNLETILFEGMYPRIQAEEKNPVLWYSSYLQTYIERDVRMMKNIGNLSLFQKFLKLCAGRVGQVINFSSLANDTGVSHHTIQSWISLLESSYIVFLVHPYYNNFQKRIIKAPKLYFYDTGVLCSLLEITSAQQVETHYAKGGIFENFVFLEQKKEIFNTNISVKNLYFFRDHNGFEIDLLKENNNKIILVEIKSGQTISSSFFTNLKKWDSLQNTQETKKFLIYGGTEHRIQENIEIINWRNADTM